MTIIKKYTLAIFASASLMSNCILADGDYLTSTDDGVSALTELSEIENADTIPEDGTYYKVETLADLPTRVKPGAIIKIRKQAPAADDPETLVIIRDVQNPQTGSSIIIQDADKDGYYTVKVPENSRSLEVEMLFSMSRKDDKYALYKYWNVEHTFEVEQDGENWSFGEN